MAASVALVECHCKLTSFSLSLPASSFPLKASLCHCHTCRHNTGQLFATWAVIPLPLPEEILKSGNLLKHRVSTCERWFCKRCGASVLNVDNPGEEGEWEVATGALHFEDPKGLEGKLDRVQLWVEDVKGDGGAVGWINQGKLKGMDRHWKARGSKMVNDESVKELTACQTPVTRDGEEQLLLQCQCQTVNFGIRPPANNYDGGPGKFEAGLDACTSCRRVTGFEIASWVFVRKEDIVVNPDLNRLLEDRSRLGHYETSKNISRYFCINCGATVFYCRQGKGTIDIAAGLLEPKVQGAIRAEAWLTWRDTPEHPEDPNLAFWDEAVDRKFAHDLKEGMQSWLGEGRKM